MITIGLTRYAQYEDFEAGKPCEAAGANHPDNANKWCRYEEGHSHGGFACDVTCPCRQTSSGSLPGGVS